jgi:hypothetical protein
LRASVGSTEASASLLARVGVVGPTRARSEAAPGEGSRSGTRVHPLPIVAGAASVPGIRGRGRSVFQATKGRGSRRLARRAPLAGRGGRTAYDPALMMLLSACTPHAGYGHSGDGHALLNERTRRRDGPEPGGRIEGAWSRPCDAQGLSWRVRSRSCTEGTTHRSPCVRPVGCTHLLGQSGLVRRGGNCDVPRIGRNARGSASS